MSKTLAIILTIIAAIINTSAKDKPVYQVGMFLSSNRVSDGTYSSASCSRYGCTGSAYSASHNTHAVSTPDGLYSIEAPVSIAGTLIIGMLSNGNAPTIHKQWFMDDLHEGDNVLFSARCNNHNRCTIDLPNPDNANKVIHTEGFFYPAIAKTNTTILCGSGRLTPAVEAQVCFKNPASQPAVIPASVNAPPVRAITQTTTSARATVAPQDLTRPINGETVSGPGFEQASQEATLSLGELARRARAKQAAKAGK